MYVEFTICLFQSFPGLKQRRLGLLELPPSRG